MEHLSDSFLKRRYTDLSPVDTHDRDAVARFKSDARLGNRSTDSILARRFTKADLVSAVIDEEKHFAPNELIISRTDLRGTITHCNEIFAKMSGWTQEELLGSNHNLIRHPDMPKVAYQLVWDLIKEKKEFYGYVKNLRKNGGYYWVFAYITADLDEDGSVAGYTSYRRFAPKVAVDTMRPIYQSLLKAEQQSGVEAAGELLSKYLELNGFSSYDQFIVDLQVKASATTH